MHGSLFQFFLLTLVVGYLVLRRRKKGWEPLRDHLAVRLVDLADDVMRVIMQPEVKERYVARFGDQNAHMAFNVKDTEATWWIDKPTTLRVTDLTSEDTFQEG